MRKLTLFGVIICLSLAIPYAVSVGGWPVFAVVYLSLAGALVAKL